MYLLSLHDLSTQFQIPNERTLIRFQVVCEQYKLLQSFNFAFYNLEARDQGGGGGGGYVHFRCGKSLVVAAFHLYISLVQTSC